MAQVSFYITSSRNAVCFYFSLLCLEIICIFSSLFSADGHSRTARVLLGMVIPGHLIFSYTISYLQAGHTSLTAIFMLVYLTAAVLQVSASSSSFKCSKTHLLVMPRNFFAVYCVIDLSFLSFFLQVLLLLYIAHVMTHWMWKRGIDPDNSAIPYLTAIGDLLGTGLLALAFQILYLIGDRDSDVGD